MNTGHANRLAHRRYPLPSTKLIDLKAGFDSGTLHPILASIQPILERLLSLDRVNRCYAEYIELLDFRKSEVETFHHALTSVRVMYDLIPENFDNIPKRGPLVVVANHPFGGLEGVILGAVLLRVRPDVRILANYLLKRVQDIGDLIIPVDPFGSPGSANGNLRGLKAAIAWLKNGGTLVTFPAGEVASFRLKTGRVSDPLWSSHVAGLIRRARAAVLPVFFPGRNSLLFQLLGLLHPRLRTALLPRELMNKSGRRIRLFVGKAIPWQRLKKYETDTAMTEHLRLRTHFLKNRGKVMARPRLRLVKPRTDKNRPQPIIMPPARSLLQNDLTTLPREQRMIESGEFAVYIAAAAQIPNLLREIGRQREITFRDAREGTRKSVDLDRFDAHYLHIFLWNQAMGELVGAYRLGLTDVILQSRGAHGLYTNQLFRYKSALLKRLTRAIEFGRSFIRLEYQRKFNSLLLLWKGIGAFIARNPQYHLLFGPVSISNDYHTVSRDLIVRFLRANRFDEDLSRFVAPRKPYRKKVLTGSTSRLLHTAVDDLEDISLLISEIEKDGKGIPILLRQYLKLNGRLVCFNVDRDFSNVVDGLLMVDLKKTDSKLLKRFMGEEGFERFKTFHGPMPAPDQAGSRPRPKRTSRQAA
jgi:putative hemolysin